MRTTEEKLHKKAVLERIKAMPERFTVDELLEHMVVVRKVERGMKELEAGKGLTTTQARKKLAKWLK
ncbi:MAG: hypothetical protein KA175_03140 [Flavobacteriales bacterium]|nr:hypothetical protein [Flavobacteriales bacterium]MBP6696587.1 hypothetical protein [Flavobacteriales bacterium]